jgi:hypothetical protein
MHKKEYLDQWAKWMIEHERRKRLTDQLIRNDLETSMSKIQLSDEMSIQEYKTIFFFENDIYKNKILKYF